jgi:hypothetical protein
MARQMERHIRCNNLLIVFQSGFCRRHSTTAAVLKVAEDIQLSMEDEQVTVLLLLDFSQAFDMVVNGLLLCKLQNTQNYSFYPLELSVLGPLLFISYIDDALSVIRYCRFHIHVHSKLFIVDFP